MIYLTCERIELVRGKYSLIRLTQESDAKWIVEWRNNPDISKWLNQWKPLTIEEHLRWFNQARERGDLLIFFESMDGMPVGCTSIFDFDHLGTSAEWGRLFSAQLGGGSIRIIEACYLLHLLCFDALGFFRLHGRVWVDNDRAWRLYQLLGWVQEGIRRKHVLSPDGYHDVRMISIFSEEFNAKRMLIEKKLYGSEQAPVIKSAEAARLRVVVSKCIHRDLNSRLCNEFT